MSAANQWLPKHIDIEPVFDEFVQTFRNGRLIRELLPAGANLPLNADYLFPDDSVIAELKCLQKNPIESSDWPIRLSKTFRSTGHSFSDLMGYLVRGQPMPEKAKNKLVSWLKDSIRTTVKTGNRQIRATKRHFGKSNAKGLLLIANDNNYGFTPENMVRVIGDAAIQLNDSHLDAVVYFTPNVFHRKPNSDIAWHIWHPLYRGDDEQLLQFVNALGREWNEYVAKVTDDPVLEREEMPQVDIANKTIATMQPVRSLGRNKKDSGS